ncbi:MAG: hypothetical protein A2W09_08185 [Deltaproteobacteria bacterium RBG_16_50_11]|nr:MAG: hypothetical protein A2W09_08185 [Deltaproteobacteria bacterium RBG_16_50_11]
MKKRKKTDVAVRESEIEDVFATYPQILSQVLDFDFDLNLIARQMELPSGRLDLLTTAKNKLYLIELKVESFKNEFLNQVLSYRVDLEKLQEEEKLVAGEITTIILVPSFRHRDSQLCEDSQVVLKQYSPDNVLIEFYRRMSGISNFLTIKPVDLGVWNIHLINRVLYNLAEENTIEGLRSKLGIAKGTIRNHLLFAEKILLVRKEKHKYYLTDLGVEYVEGRDPKLSDSYLSERQTHLLQNRIARDPFASETIFGIYTVVESIFTLARNAYPVHFEQLVDYFRETVGKRTEWNSKRSAFLGAGAYSNFAVELGLVARVGDMLMLTPAGFRFILMLQLHKGIKIVDAMGFE